MVYEAPIPQWELTEHLVAALESLRQTDREVIVLRYFEEMDVEQIADIIEIKTHAVESRLSRARGRLAKSLRRAQAAENVA